ncbi:purine-nucleoside phosphorylase [Segetibacter sp.]|jgi:purine-nucleoside phosphorylase|uniref:purine-nucleoside phosphorylase n=1 Tax=Segetibacter sp. TaxID=2231182 RepID=UPI002618DF39|nr:purine-nucleoside phosphorylase [Segetibacter sp.]MCW3080325.1 purine nucleoside phosphorylase [Segetibacter sp.]
MSLLIDQLNETTAFIRQQCTSTPTIGIILGSGLGNFIGEMEVEIEISYSDLPHFPVSTVEGHSGKLIFGEMGGKKVVAMAGRFHFYEGYTPQQVVYPVRVMKMLGVDTVLISNAAGGVNKNFAVGDLMIIRDHISFFAINPLLGKNEDKLGSRFPDMSEPYSHALIAKAKSVAERLQIPLQTGVYTGVTGPTFETRAEYQLIQILGGDAVGMSTVQEVIAAVHADMRVFAMSVITDIGIREEENTITHEEVLQAARDAEPKLTAIFTQLIAEL